LLIFLDGVVIKKKTIKPNLNVDLVASSSVKVIYSNSDKELTIKENRGKSGVYRWVNILTGDTYIGSAVSLSKRFSVYCSEKSIKEVLRRSNSKILSALLKYGFSNFRLEILEYCEPNQTINREQYYLDQLFPEYNILPLASSSLGKLQTKETKLKISNSLKGRLMPEEVKKKWVYLVQEKLFL
jgi:group I intron endonuclease